MQVGKRWLLKDHSGSWIGIDSNSGGYPVLVDFWSAHKFMSLREAVEYNSIFKNPYMIYECDEVGTRFVSDTSEEKYKLELEALNKKYGKV